MQKMYDWRSGFADAAVTAVDALWASNPKFSTPEAKAEYVANALSSGSPFLYAHIPHNGSSDAIVVSDSDSFLPACFPVINQVYFRK